MYKSSSIERGAPPGRIREDRGRGPNLRRSRRAHPRIWALVIAIAALSFPIPARSQSGYPEYDDAKYGVAAVIVDVDPDLLLVFGTRAHRTAKAWMKQHDVSPTADAASTLALIVQTALAIQDFDPGPRDGIIGRRSIAAIMAWRAVAGLSEGASFADVLAGVLHAALVLD